MKLPLALIATLAASPALAQSLCFPRADLVATLETQFSETVRVRGTIGTSAIMEVWGSANAETWTLVRTTAQGVSCILAAGQDFVQFSVTPDGEPM